MTIHAWPSQPEPIRLGAAATVQALSRALAGRTYVPTRRGDLEARLGEIVDLVLQGLLAEQFRSQPGVEAGAALVAAHITDPDAAGVTLEIIGTRLLDDPQLTAPDRNRRLAVLIGAMAAGYARALRDLTLSEQESIHQAALVAQGRAEQALRASESRRWHEAHHDPLTGLPNRVQFGVRLADLVEDPASDARVGVCLVDIDALKFVTDSLGHDAGDQLLVAVADRLRQFTDGDGTLVTRLDGDEFGILVANSTGTDQLVDLARAVLDALAEPMNIGGQPLSMSASAGVVERPVAGAEPAELMRAAHLTLSWAKEDGGNRYAVFDPARNARAAERYALSVDMPRALERGEFTVAFQPIVSLSDGRVGGLEALVRWRHPQLGVLGPARFIELAEESTLIVALGRTVLRLACEQAVGWAALTAAPPFVSVNLAVAQTRHAGLPEDVARILKETGLPPGRLQLEITESAMMGTDETPLTTLRRLADTGVRIAIDDFGTGWANLAYLRDLPVCNLKLDASFVRGLLPPAAPNPADEQIIAGLTSLGHALGLTVTAEGVEAAVQADRLRDLGCDTGQGWFFAHPTEPDEVAQLLT